MDIKLILGSAFVGAIAGGVISLMGQWLDRRSREEQSRIDRTFFKRDAIFKAAMELTKLHLERLYKSSTAHVIHDPAVHLEKYLEWSKELYINGKLPDDPQIKRFESDIATESRS